MVLLTEEQYKFWWEILEGVLMKSTRIGLFVTIWSFWAFYSFVCPTDSCLAKYSGGAGTPGDPYKIASATDLTTMAGNTADYDKNFVLTADINLAPRKFTTAVIAPDGDNSDTYFDGTPFTGDFNGAGHQISNLAINTYGVQNDFLGLFGLISGQVENLNMVNVSIVGGDASYYAGGLAGENDGNVINCSSSGTITAGYELQYAGGLVGENDGNVISCSSAVALTSRDKAAFVGGLVGYNYGDDINDCIATGTVKCGNDSYYIAGLVGYNDYGDINNCSSSGKVTAGDGADSVGGLIGDNGGTISRCLSSGAVTGGTNSWRFGGLIGVSYQSNISNCASTGNVSDGNNSQYIGGLVGDDNDRNITDCCSTGTVMGSDNSVGLGGLIGNNEGSTTITRCYSKSIVTGGNGVLQIGGLVGYNYDNDINNCVATGAVTGGNDSSYIGGLVGYNDSGDIIDCCSTGKITAGNDTDSVGGLVGENDGSVERSLATGAVIGGNEVYYLGGLIGENYLGRVRDSYATGAVTAADDSESVGGLVGDNDSGNIGYCSSMAKVTAGNESDSIGGLVGSNNHNIFRCFSTSAVSAKADSYYLGGLVGYSDHRDSVSDCFSSGAVTASNSSSDFGGLAGIIFGTNIKNCYSTGVVTASDSSYEIGGLAGWCDSNTSIISSYFLASSGPDNGYGQPLPDANMKQQSSFVGWDFVGETANGSNDIWDICPSLDYPKLAWTFSYNYKIGIDKCTVTAGAKKKLGSIAFSGIINATACNFANADVVNVAIDSEYMDTRVLTFPVSGHYKKGKYSFSGTQKGVKESFKFDSKTLKFSVSAQNIDLSGLSCPLNVRINIGDYNTEAALDETIINGPKKSAPVNLLMGFGNFLRVDKTQVKHDKTGDQLIITGAFAVKDANVNLTNISLFVTLGPRIFMIPANNFKYSSGTYSCSGVGLFDSGTIGARFDFNKYSFVITLKHYSVPSYSGTVNFGIDFVGFSEATNASITP